MLEVVICSRVADEASVISVFKVAHDTVPLLFLQPTSRCGAQPFCGCEGDVVRYGGLIRYGAV